MGRPAKSTDSPANEFKRFGAALRMLRHEAGVGLRSLAKQVGVSSAYLSRVETGRDPPPTPERLEAIGAALDVPAAVLVDLAGRTGAALDGYVARVPAAGALFLDIARRDLDAQQIARLAAFVRDEQAPSTAPAVGLLELLRPARIRLHVPGRQLGDLIDAGARLCARDVDSVSAAQLAAQLHARESEASTALGKGVAVPHAVIEGARASAALLIPARSLRTNTPDAAPVRAVFVLVCGDREQHLQLLAAVARLASHNAATELAGARTARQARQILARC